MTTRTLLRCGCDPGASILCAWAEILWAQARTFHLRAAHTHDPEHWREYERATEAYDRHLEAEAVAP